MMLDLEISRRRLLLGGACLMAASLLPKTALASRSAPVRELRLYSPYTGDRVAAPYWENGSYVQDTLHELNWLCRDRREDKQIPIDARLFDQLFELQRRLGVQREIHVICGYRTPKTNAMLRRNTSGVAKHSLHMSGRAVDIRIPGVATSHIRKAALSLRAGGVGYYPHSNFVHLDTGRVRHW